MKLFSSYHVLVTNLLALSTLLLATPSFAQNPSGDYDFDLTCAPETRHTILSKRPALLTILDVSGSMSGAGNSSGVSKLKLAQTAIKEVADSISRPGACDVTDTSGCDLVEIGIGHFSDEAQVDVEPGEDKGAEVKIAVDDYEADGSTYIGKAAKVIHDSPNLGGLNNIGIGVLVSDGQPSDNETIRQTLHYLCKARDRKPRTVLTFAVGFGEGADPYANSLFAAAGGTGFCCKASGGLACATNPGHPDRFDPCTDLDRSAPDELSLDKLSTYNVACAGGLQADSGQDLKNAFLAIVARSACTFPLEIPMDYPAGVGADPNPGATKVIFNHRVLGPDIVVPYVGDSYILIPETPAPLPNPLAPQSTELRDYLLTKPVPASQAVADAYLGEGWVFANPERSAIILTPDLCQDVVYKYEVTEVFTQVACLCQNTAESCEVPCFKEGCLEREACATKSAAQKDACEAGCRNDPASACQQGVNELYGRSELQQVGRCRPGVVECIVGKEYCAPLYEPQPEICNGEDDSCSGMVDDLSSVQTSLYPVTQLNPEVQGVLSVTVAGESAFCGYKDDACGCAGASNGFGTPTKLTGESGFKEMLRLSKAPANTCGCVETLEAASSQDTPGAQGGSSAQPQAGGCSSMSTRPAPHAVLWPLLLGLVVWRRRRRA